MARIVYAAPDAGRFHFHERLGRELVNSGHEVRTLLADRASATFWRAQGHEVTRLRGEAPDAMRAPIEEFAARECSRIGVPPGAPGHHHARRRIERRLAGLLPATLRTLSHTAPDLVFLHGERTAERRLVHFVARELGVRVLWTGDGLIPHTLQIDESGVDGDAAALRRGPFDYRSAPADPSMLENCLAHLLAHTTPFALTRRAVQRPPLRPRLLDALAALRAGALSDARRALTLWRDALPPPEQTHWLFELPDRPFVTVLLQDPTDERVRLDCPQPPTAHALVSASVRAARELAPSVGVVAVLPRTGLPHRELRAVSAIPTVRLAPSSAAIEAAATAVATVTINHPFAVAALLAGTPVLHTGRALYGLQSVTCQVPTDGLAAELPRHAGRDRTPSLRERQLTWLLGQGHLWCSGTHPDHNGILGLTQEIGARLGHRRPEGLLMRYRHGPAWPLSTK